LAYLPKTVTRPLGSLRESPGSAVAIAAGNLGMAVLEKKKPDVAMAVLNAFDRNHLENIGRDIRHVHPLTVEHLLKPVRQDVFHSPAMFAYLVTAGCFVFHA